jgi:hypothetical protein
MRRARCLAGLLFSLAAVYLSPHQSLHVGKTPPHMDFYTIGNQTQTGSNAGSLIRNVQKGDERMNRKGKTSIQENKTKATAATLSRWAGLSAVAAGLGFIVVGLFHPVNVPSSVTTATWANVHIVAIAMCFFGLFGMAGLYARQAAAARAGWLGLTGFVLFSIWLAIVMGFSFVEAFILPLLAAESPAFVEGFLGMFTGIASEIPLGVLPTLWTLSGPLFIVGPLLFGIATFRAGILPRGAAGLLALGSVLIPAGALLPPEYEPLVMVPVGLGLAWLGYAIFAERGQEISEALSSHKTAQTELNQVA